jgi:hypothetical protein
MNRRAFIAGLGSLTASWPLACHAQPPSDGIPSSQNVLRWGAWKWRPSIVVMSGKGDPRVPAVHEARNFWNAELSKLRTSFRLGPVSHIPEYVRLDELNRPPDDLLNFVTKTGGDVVVALSYDSTRSFTTQWRSSRKLFILIASEKTDEFKTPGAARNLVAQELGHTIGLRRNECATVLKCGDSVWTFPGERFLPLTDQEKAQLAEMYPPNWKNEPPPRKHDLPLDLDDDDSPAKSLRRRFEMSRSEI